MQIRVQQLLVRSTMSTSGMSVAHETVKSVMAEFIGSFLFQFLGGACISNATEHGLGSGAIGNGFAFAIVLYAVTNVSGGHVNPAITAAFRATHRISNTNALAFICAQIIGSIIGAGFLRLCLPASAPAFITIGSLTDSEPGMTLIWEFLSTFFVVFVVYAVTFNKDFKPIGPFAIGVRNIPIYSASFYLRGLQLAVTAATFASGPFTGSSFNPSRTLAAAFVFGSFHQVLVWHFFSPCELVSLFKLLAGLDLPPCHFGWRSRCRSHV